MTSDEGRFGGGVSGSSGWDKGTLDERVIVSRAGGGLHLVRDCSAAAKGDK